MKHFRIAFEARLFALFTNLNTNVDKGSSKKMFSEVYLYRALFDNLSVIIDLFELNIIKHGFIQHNGNR